MGTVPWVVRRQIDVWSMIWRSMVTAVTAVPQRVQSGYRCYKCLQSLFVSVESEYGMFVEM
jgi:hypothetical protein